ncbi:MAG: tRNA (adenosine(37)-N6)-threonylcarbamoyltransferase complex transferase subunit TsaD [Candidatus Omnitrophica bacterium]|nr:tRNA (adenosine(37)-N6)-threonylcarbamoyltransferase complex transferase subunit TsaD [Candidatus Omnitrophota bacterium]
MLTLGIETSCDETSCAVIEGTHSIRSNVVSSSLFRHQPFGGVVPEIASRHCLEQIDVVFKEALRQAAIKPEDIDLIAVTEGPGLMGSLLVGVSFAKGLSYELGVPLVGVNHLEAHLVANFLNAGKDQKPQRMPQQFIGLLVSGGHTMITYHQRGRVTILGETVDDAVGEAYDKVAKILNLGYPGGPVIDRLAREGNPDAIRFTKPKQKRRFDFSFSGVKTAVLYYVQNQRRQPDWNEEREKQLQKDLAASFQKAAVSWLVDKTLDAAVYKKVKTVIVGGGVSANSHLRQSLTETAAHQGLKVSFPTMALAGDNAAMIARRGVELYRSGKRASLKLTANPNLKIKARRLNL